ncbi:MAG: choice-of-anchor tandem repeat GloVer-containing protein [Candidatus Sulfotelmatobacter sp.]
MCRHGDSLAGADHVQDLVQFPGFKRLESRLLQGTDGNLFGTTEVGGGTAEGTVFKFATTASKPTTLYKFCATGSLCPNGSKPYAGLVLASNGKFYGTTTLGGTTDNGTVFQITSTGSFKTIYNFGGTTTGSLPWATPIQATDGDLYGGTSIGGTDIEPPREPIALGARHVFSLLESRLGLQTAWRSGKDSNPRYRFAALSLDISVGYR